MGSLGGSDHIIGIVGVFYSYNIGEHLFGDLSFRILPHFVVFNVVDFKYLSVCKMKCHQQLVFFFIQKDRFCLLLVNLMLNLNGTAKGAI